MTARRSLDDLTHGAADWAGLKVVVTGLGVSGFAAADALLERDAKVTVLDAGTGRQHQEEQAQILRVLDADVRLGAEHVSDLPADLADADLVVTSPGWRPDHPVLTAAAGLGIPVWGEVELAWRMRPQEGAAPWLTVTGTNGKTTTVQMLAAILTAAGLRATAAGNVGTPILEAVLHPEPYAVIAVELSSFQLHWSESIAPVASCCLNVAPDHVDWHGSLEEYTAAKGKVYEHTELACIYNVQDPVTEQLVRDADVQEGCRAVGFTLGTPGLSMVGLVEDVLADRAFIEERRSSAAELATLADLTRDGVPPAPHLVADALAAAALARAVGVPVAAVRDGLRGFEPDQHRITDVGEVAGVRFVNDSKATNPHAAAASLTAFEHIVWVAGGQLKGADVDGLVAGARARQRAVVLLGQDREQIAAALTRHAPEVPVVRVSAADTGDMGRDGQQTRGTAEALAAVMDEVVDRALGLARPGDVVLLAPAAASLDMWPNYGARGTDFTGAVARRRDRGETS